MSEKTICKVLFVVILLIIVHALLQVFEIKHPDFVAWLIHGTLAWTATQAYRFTMPPTERSDRQSGAILGRFAHGGLGIGELLQVRPGATSA